MDDIAELILAVQQAADELGAQAALRGVYAELAEEVDRRRPKCDASGRCCRFDAYGHRLYVTTLELGAFVREQPMMPMPESGRLGGRRLVVVDDGGACPFQVDRLCTVHAIRPFGCRIFYCDPSAEQWQQDLYERFHSQIKQLHQQYAIPYFYVEWRTALAAVLPTLHQVSAP